MKIKQQSLAAILLFIASTMIVVAQPTAGNMPAMVDPATGLPVNQPAREWKDPSWPDPAKVLPEVNFDGLPVSEVARYLREQFSNNFDIMIPSSYTSGSAPGNNPALNQSEQFDTSVQVVKLQLRNVTASEVFHAMNLLFEAQNDPVQWQLVMNGNRPTALLRVVPELLPHAPVPPSEPEQKRMVFFVGNLVGDEKFGGMTMGKVVETVELTYFSIYKHNLDVHVLENAQLLTMAGSPEQIDFIKQTLEALKQKVDLARKEKSNTVESTPKPDSSAATK